MIAPYHRDELPDDVDHSTFGREIPQITLTTEDCPVDRIRRESETFAFVPSTVIPSNTPGAQIYGQCDAKLSHALSGPVSTTLFLPDHAALIEFDGRQNLLHESIWHTHLFYSEHFRNDRSTKWNWRTVYDGKPDVSIPQLVMNCYHRFSYQYFHWFVEVMPRVWLASRSGFKPRDALWFLGPLTQPFQRPSLELFGIYPSDICDVPDTAIVAFQRATNAAFAFDEPLGTLRPSFTSGKYHVGWSKDYLNEIRDRAYFALKVPRISGDKKIFIDRRKATHRKIVNQEAVINEVQKAGFEIIDPGVMDFADQIRCFSQARIILAPHGAGLTNVIWAPPGAIVAEFMPIGLNDVGYRFLGKHPVRAAV